mmetsp:Transcript_28846/g.76082  ORF Transcript_28846/g.76082 Transcript_28846/m.76082 type:complete len:279 (-) Transcript_28846:133-969(-)
MHPSNVPLTLPSVAVSNVAFQFLHFLCIYIINNISRLLLLVLLLLPLPCDVPLWIIAFFVFTLTIRRHITAGEGCPNLPRMVRRKQRRKESARTRWHTKPQRKAPVQLPNALHQRLCTVHNRTRDGEGQPAENNKIVRRALRRSEPCLRLHDLREQDLSKRLLHAQRIHLGHQWDADHLYTCQHPTPILKHAVRRTWELVPTEGSDHLSFGPHAANFHTLAAIRYRQLLRHNVVRVHIQAGVGTGMKGVEPMFFETAKGIGTPTTHIERCCGHRSEGH